MQRPRRAYLVLYRKLDTGVTLVGMSLAAQGGTVPVATVGGITALGGTVCLSTANGPPPPAAGSRRGRYAHRYVRYVGSQSAPRIASVLDEFLQQSAWRCLGFRRSKSTQQPHCLVSAFLGNKQMIVIERRHGVNADTGFSQKRRNGRQKSHRIKGGVRHQRNLTRRELVRQRGPFRFCLPNNKRRSFSLVKNVHRYDVGRKLLAPWQ